jgi:Protein of unknown function (DUF2934)
MQDEALIQDYGHITQLDIMVRANQKWAAAGMPNGDGSRFWVEAEKELRQEAVQRPTQARARSA